MDANVIPSELLALPRWVVWKYEMRDGKPTKVPHSARGGMASSTDAATWSTHAEATAALSKGAWDGIGFVFARGDGLVGIDLDDCAHNGELSADARAILAQFPTYAEISPSGTGVKLFMRGSLEGKARRRDVKRGIEMYADGRYFTVTGRIVEGHPSEVRDCQAALDAFYTSVFARQEPERRASMTVGGGGGGASLADAEIVQRAASAKNGEKFKRLWAGDTTGYKTEDNGGHSEADLALCAMLAFWCGEGGASRVDALFRQSGLYREKWEREDYRARTISAAYSGVREFYTPAVVVTPEKLKAAFGDEQPPTYVTTYDKPSDAAEASGVAEPRPAPLSPPHAVPDTSAIKYREGVANVETRWIEVDGKRKAELWYRNIDAISESLLKVCDKWPKSCAGLLFSPNGRGGVRYLNRSDDVFSWLAQCADVRWYEGQARSLVTGVASAVTKGEFVSHLKATVPDRFIAVSELPHEPTITGVYYMPLDLPKATGKALAKFLELLNPETEHDRQLLLALILTPMWGGPCGARPAFILSSDHGRGAGKTTTANAIADIYGGAFRVQNKETWEQVSKRLLGDRALALRMLLRDNVKGKVAAEEMESFITDPEISGWRPFHGDFCRPNYMTVVFTANAPRLGADMADRAVEIRIGDRKHGFNFQKAMAEFMAEHRLALIADIVARIKEPPRGTISSGNRIRWGAWMDAILTRCDNPDALAALVRERQAAADTDSEDAEDVARVLDQWAAEGKLAEDSRGSGVWRVTRDQMREILVDAGVADENVSKKGAHSIICNMLGSHGPLSALIDNPRRRIIRCWLWTPKPDIPV